MKLKVEEFLTETHVSAGGRTVRIRKAGSVYRVTPEFSYASETAFDREDALSIAEEMLEVTR